MTAHVLKGDEERCLQAGMDGYVPKPVSPKELISVVESVSIPLSSQASAVAHHRECALAHFVIDEFHFYVCLKIEAGFRQARYLRTKADAITQSGAAC